MPQLDVNAALDDGRDVFFQNRARQAERGNADADLAAQIRLALEDRHVVPVAPHSRAAARPAGPPPTIATRLPLSS